MLSLLFASILLHNVIVTPASTNVISYNPNGNNVVAVKPHFCPPNWKLYGAVCYNVFNTKLTFDDAAKECVRSTRKLGKNGRLAEIASAGIDGFITSSFSNLESAWIGLRWYHNHFVWTNGYSLLHFTNWRANQPDNYDGHEHCVHMHKYPNGAVEWNDLFCGKKKQYVCQVDSSLVSYDARHWTEWFAVGACSTTCGSGKQKYVRSCSDNNMCHGRSEEKYDECQKGNCPCDWKKFDSHCYKAFNNESLNCFNAIYYCEKLYGGHLLIVRSKEENNFIVNKMDLSIYGYFMALIRDYDTLHWSWTDRSKPLYQNWLKGEPNNADKREFCGTYWKHIENNVYGWNDFDCEKKLPFICKFPLGRDIYKFW